MYLILALDNVSILKYCRSGHQLRFTWKAWFLVGIVLLTSCNSKKYLKEDQSFLIDNKISFKSEHRIPNKSDLQENLLTLYRQRQTRTVAGIPRHVFYYQYQRSLARNPDRKKWDEERLIKNRPVIHDSLKAVQTTEDFERYLALRGYRSSNVTFRSKTSNRETTVFYQVNPGPRLEIDSFFMVAEDTALVEFVRENPEKPFMRRGHPLDIQLYNQERQRIVNILQNEGYATFDENYVSPLEVDTVGGQVKATMRLLNPSDSTLHLQYYAGDVIVYPDYNIVETISYVDTTINYITYMLPDTPVFTLKPEVIYRNLFVRPGELTRKDELNRTIKNLSRMDLIRFVNPQAEIDTTAIYTPTIDYTFFLTRNKKIPFVANAELTYSTIAARERRSLAGMNFNVNYRDRNTFKGAEVLNLNVDMGFEVNFRKPTEGTDRQLINTFNMGLGSAVTFPRFMDPLRMYHIIGHSKRLDQRALFGRKLRKVLLEDAATRVSAGYNYVDIRDLYQYHAFNANLSYDAQPDPHRKLTIDRFGFDLFVPTAKPAFDTILQNNPFQRASFGKQLFTGFIFRNYLYEINSKTKPKTGYFKLLHSVELSGLEMFIINSLISPSRQISLGPRNDPDKVVNFSHFIKGEVDMRYYRDIKRQTQFAFRFNTGVASPFGPFTQQVPFLKQFFVGGALSNRAWQIRELGPGSFQDTAAVNPNLPFYQTGDFKIDMSAEIRFKLFWYFKGALFMDASNVWTLKDASRPEANLSTRFYKEFGIGYGYGIRLDVEFFILRFDMGYKLHNPYPVLNSAGKTSRWLLDELKKWPGGFEPQIAVGLPF